MNIIAIDPGTSGGIASFDDGGGVGVWKMPETPHDLAGLLMNFVFEIDKAYVERVGCGGRPGRKFGAAGMWKFGYGVGVIHGVLAALKIPYELIAPGVWQRALGCLTKGDKNVSKAKAQQLFPHLKVTHAIADALLIGEYARRQNARSEECHPSSKC